MAGNTYTQSAATSTSSCVGFNRSIARMSPHSSFSIRILPRDCVACVFVSTFERRSERTSSSPSEVIIVQPLEAITNARRVVSAYAEQVDAIVNWKPQPKPTSVPQLLASAGLASRAGVFEDNGYDDLAYILGATGASSASSVPLPWPNSARFEELLF